MDRQRLALRQALGDPAEFSRRVIGMRLRRYQVEPIRAIARAISAGEGGAFALMFARQAGKNELSAHLEAWALARWQHAVGAQLIKTAPTLRPQLTNSIIRLQRVLGNPLTRGR
jgi:hypothetical protein